MTIKEEFEKVLAKQIAEVKLVERRIGALELQEYLLENPRLSNQTKRYLSEVFNDFNKKGTST